MRLWQSHLCIFLNVLDRITSSTMLQSYKLLPGELASEPCELNNTLQRVDIAVQDRIGGVVDTSQAELLG